ncbi:hypothetical protein ACH495_13960 [Micromonospora sp. NPDC018662]|uniref:hypothetical protein n=1 Tax=Micromonospora sp. NPDC018662 TaxID=3364238 RepID=UPI0037985C75
MRALKDILYFEMSKDSFRKTLRDMAFGNTELEGSSVDAVNGYLAICRSIGARRGKRLQLTQGLYANTFEWYISQLFVREFAARASGFGIRLKDADPGDEFDCVALLDEGLVFVECKTGKGSLYPEVGKFVRRDREVMAKYSFFLYDRDYTFNKGPEDLPELEKASAVKLGIDSIARVEKGGCAFFEVTGIPNEHGETRFFLASSAFNGLRSRMRYMLRYTDHVREFENPTLDFVHIPLGFA